MRFDSDGTNQATEVTVDGLQENTQMHLRYSSGSSTYRVGTTAGAAASSAKDTITFRNN